MKMQQIRKGIERCLVVIVLGIFTTTLWAYELEATTQWYQRIDLTPLSSGTVRSVTVRVGDQVTQGDLLLQLEENLESSQLQLARQRLKQAELLYTEAQRENERIVDLYERTLISDHDRAIGEVAWAGASAALDAAKMALATAERAHHQRELRAPYNAVVIARQVEVGTITNHQLLQTPLLTIASSTSMLIEGYLKASQLAQVVGKQSLQVKVAGKKFKGKVEGVAMEPDTAMPGKYKIRLLIPYSKGFRSGMNAVISVD